MRGPGPERRAGHFSGASLAEHHRTRCLAEVQSPHIRLCLTAVDPTEFGAPRPLCAMLNAELTREVFVMRATPDHPTLPLTVVVIVVALTMTSVAGCTQRSPASGGRAGGDAMTARPQPIDPVWSPDIAPSDAVLAEIPAAPQVSVAVQAASHALSLARRRAAPARWRCDEAERKALAARRNHRRLKAASDRTAQARWADDELLRTRVGRDHDDDYWPRIRWGYLLRGVCDPEYFVTQGIVETTFLGQPLRVHAHLAPRMANIERTLATSEGGSPDFQWLGAFAARTVRGPFKASNKLSNHAFGMAIDFEPINNPYLAKRELRLLEQITGIRIKRKASITAGERWDHFKEVEAAFLNKVDAWLKDLDGRIAGARKAGARGTTKRLETQREQLTRSRNLTRAMERGSLMIVPRHFVVAMEDAGLTWATDFGPGADMMHFELRAAP